MSAIVFLDRDGVFNHHLSKGVRRVEDLEFLPGVAEAHARLQEAGAKTCLTTNQPWVGLGLMSQKTLDAIHGQLQGHLRTCSRGLDRIESAGAPPGLGHRRRKPKPGMLQDGAEALGGEGPFFMVGDKPRDVAAGAAFGATTILLGTTKSQKHWLAHDWGQHPRPDVIAKDLPDAADWIVQRLKANAQA